MMDSTTDNQKPQQQLDQLKDKVKKDNEVDKRQMLANIIFNIPGIRYKDLSRITQFKNGTLSYHLLTLEKNTIVRVYRPENSNVTRYYSIDVPMEETITLGYLKMKTTSKILRLLYDNDCLTFSEITSRINKAPSTTSWNLKRLYEAKIVVRKKQNEVTVFSLKNPKILEKLIEKTNNTLLDRSV
ncbi:MAG: winged helix-turn-helix transcriptional regulator, partial [Candidatus Nitrosocosmicus sp.]|nr:winged helix-turn-helix transcriptional regulator [Candidatus Nitrosocosmicus sp.]